MKLYPYRLPLKNGSFREGILVQNGANFGDIAPLPGFSKETLAQAKEDALHAINTNEEPKLPSVRFAFACAHTPLPNSLAVPIASLDREAPGFQAIKVKLGHLSLREAIDRIKALPKHLEIRADFNRKWDLEDLLRFASHFSPKDFAYLEEPAKTFEELLAFSEQTGMPIAVDESIPDIPYWDIPTLKALIVKPTILGYVPKTLPGVELIFSSAYESGIGVLHIARLCNIYTPHRPHGLDPYTHLLQDVISPRPTLQDGHLTWRAPLRLTHGHR